jgi:hypothetical protein
MVMTALHHARNTNTRPSRPTAQHTHNTLHTLAAADLHSQPKRPFIMETTQHFFSYYFPPPPSFFFFKFIILFSSTNSTKRKRKKKSRLGRLLVYFNRPFSCIVVAWDRAGYQIDGAQPDNYGSIPRRLDNWAYTHTHMPLHTFMLM